MFFLTLDVVFRSVEFRENNPEYAKTWHANNPGYHAAK